MKSERVETNVEEEKKNIQKSLNFNLISHFPCFRFHLRQFNWLNWNETKWDERLPLPMPNAIAIFPLMHTFLMFSKMCSTFKIPNEMKGNSNWERNIDAEKTGTKTLYFIFILFLFHSHIKPYTNCEWRMALSIVCSLQSTSTKKKNCNRTETKRRSKRRGEKKTHQSNKHCKL